MLHWILASHFEKKYARFSTKQELFSFKGAKLLIKCPATQAGIFGLILGSQRSIGRPGKFFSEAKSVLSQVNIEFNIGNDDLLKPQ